jgi:transcription termination factor Rho
MDIGELQDKKLNELRDLARDIEVPAYSTKKKQDLIYEIMRTNAEGQGLNFRGGVLEIVQDDKQTIGFLRSKNYLPGQEDVYVSNSQIRRIGLRTGDMVMGQVRLPKDNEKFYSLLRVEAVNNTSPDRAKNRPRYEDLTPIFPDRKLKLETNPNILSTRMLDLVAPIGRGQRGLIVSPP